MCVGVQLTIKIREYEYCRLDLAVEQQVGEWGNAGGEVETAFAAKLPGSNHHHITTEIAGRRRIAVITTLVTLGLKRIVSSALHGGKEFGVLVSVVVFS